ncbi:MAG: hypothetical protein K2G39_08935, partial [Lachnospiraceae bacterium]|nr:hypothetical protein [Lachnospiraceae bacterium]
CPNCGGNLKFDIASQQLKCDYCLTLKDPYEVTKDKDAEESSAFDVTVFTCPQCGGEILSTDTSAAEFCSFCGGSTILDSRISKEKRPAYIIPFKKTKDECKEIYISKMKRALFAPDELKDKKYIDGFRGIYIPYWAYTVSQKGPVHMKAQKSYSKGNYNYTDYYDISGEINACYNDLSYDASSSFSDAISEQIAPFDVKQTVQFSPSFLSGFYADTADVDSSIYKEDAIKVANDSSRNQIRNTPAFRDLSFSLPSSNSELNAMLRTRCSAPERTMYPVWFMSYRKGDRVAYATVNGQTGKVAADIPVDPKKYILGSLLLALPIFLLLNLFFTFKPTFTLGLSAILAVLTFIIHMAEVRKINVRDQRMDDRGYLSQQSKSTQSSKPESSAARGGFWGSVLAGIAAALIFIINPVADYWYYAGTIIAFIGVLFTIIAIIKKYNILATRKLPQFDRKGGDDRA